MISSKEDIILELEIVSKEFTGFCSGINDQLFFQQPPDKWSVAQNVKHLITATRITGFAFSIPKLVVRLYAGKPNRPSRNYDELVEKYKLKLARGGRASGPYIPKIVSAENSKEKILNSFSGSMHHVALCIQNKWTDPQLDSYIAPHPLLGKITLRELGFFTIHHTRHHLNNIKRLLSA